VYDALHDKEVTDAWLRHIEANHTEGALAFHRGPGAGAGSLPVTAPSLVADRGAEQHLAGVRGRRDLKVRGATVRARRLHSRDIQRTRFQRPRRTFTHTEHVARLSRRTSAAVVSLSAPGRNREGSERSMLRLVRTAVQPGFPRHL